MRAEVIWGDTTVYVQPSSVLEVVQTYADYRAQTGSLFLGAKAEKFSYDRVASELRRAIALGRESSDVETLRRRFDERYSGGDYVTYGLAQANEIEHFHRAPMALFTGEAVVHHR